ncbi:DNA breaking-rejoining enzyme [Suillus brevipes Sb2]|nr:DNA breaking-rejoining enzyme [Suillus brevipes Sb2]
MSNSGHSQALAQANVASTLALLREALATSPVAGVPPSVARPHRIKPRKPKAGNEISTSSFRPLVPARDRLRLWSAPHSDSFHSSVLGELHLNDVLQLFDVMLISLEVKTRENYGAGLLRFHQFCDSRNIPEHRRMPAPEFLLASFIASWAGRVATTTAQNWLAGLHFWHNLNGAPWNGSSLLRSTTVGLSKVVPETSKRPRRPPVTLDHMHALFCDLDLSNAFDASVFAVASVSFWCCCRLGELVIDSPTRFNPSRHVSRTMSVRRCLPKNGTEYTVFHIPWTKTTHGEGADIIASKLDDPTNPVSALNHHLAANVAIPDSAPLFAFETSDGNWSPLTRKWFVDRCNQIWRKANLLELTGHCFRIGGASELLLRGVPPDVVAMQGRWKSRAFLEYWRKIESILPLFVTDSFKDSRIAMVHSSMDSFSKRYK